jgi:hypothetical protein
VTDASTLGGYVAVHARPPAFEGVDGMAYSVDIGVDETGDPAAPLGAYLLFVRWGTGADGPAVKGHVESAFLATGTDEADVRAIVERMPLLTVKATLDGLIRRAS